MTETKYIIALCPVTPCYLHRDTADAYRSEGKYGTADKSQARLFDTFDAAMQVANKIKGWGGAQRVEQVAVAASPITKIQRALRGLTAEQKIVALVNALVEAGITLGRDDGCADPDDMGKRDAEVFVDIPEKPANWGTATVLTFPAVEHPVPFITYSEIMLLDMIVAASLKPEYSGWNIIDISNRAYCDLETDGHIEIPARYTVTNHPVVIYRKNLS